MATGLSRTTTLVAAEPERRRGTRPTARVLRRTRPDAVRPYKAIGYPVLPIVYIVMALFIDVVLLRYKPQYTWPGLSVVLLGIPVYYAWAVARRKSEKESA